MADEPSERAVLRKEQERERRRIRDRESRHSMTPQERVKHLSRRRRNYQLRRLRAAGAANLLPPARRNLTPLLPFPNQEHQAAVIPIPVVHLQIDALASDASPQSSYPGQEIIVTGLEVQSCAIDKFPGKSRLNHIKHLARSLADTSDVHDANLGVVIAAAEDLVVKANAVPIGTCNFQIPLTEMEFSQFFTMPFNTTRLLRWPGALRKGLRLSRIKRLARESTSFVKTSQDHATERQGDEFQPTAPPVSQPDSDKVIDER